jgi:hypothetical protein
VDECKPLAVGSTARAKYLPVVNVENFYGAMTGKA